MMRQFILLFVGLGFSLAANALPFDAFEGEFRVLGQPTTYNEGAASCDTFKNITSFAVKTETSGGRLTQFLNFNYADGSGYGFGITTDFYASDPIPGSNRLNYYRATGNNDYATLEEGILGDPKYNDRTTTTIMKNGPIFTLLVVEQFLSYRNFPVASCRYQLNLVR